MSDISPDNEFDVFVSYASPCQQKVLLVKLKKRRDRYAKTISGYKEQLEKESSPEKKQDLENEIIQYKYDWDTVSQEIYTLERSNDWVSNLVVDLKLKLSQELNIEAEKIKIWLEPSTDEATSLPLDRKQQAVQNSAVFLAILSDRYLDSERCRKESKHFFDDATHRGGDPKRRIFVVQQTETGRERWPQEFDGVRVCSLFKRDYEDTPARTLGMPELDPKDQNVYFGRLGDLSRYLAECLQYQQTATPLQHTIESKATIFLAEATADLDELRDNFRREMEIDGWRVLPETHYNRRSPAAFEKTMTEDLNKCDLFVQLLGRYTTQKTEELPKGYEGLQLDMANRAGKPILRWLDSNNSDLKVEFIDDQDLLNLLNQAPYKRMSYLDFKEEVKRQARMCAAYRGRPATESKAFTLVDASSEDVDLAKNLCMDLYKNGIGYDPIYPIDRNYPKDKDSLSRLIEAQKYDGSMVVYGECEEDWFKERIRQYRPILFELEEKKQELVCAIYIGPPPEEPSRANKQLPINPPKFLPIYTPKDPTYKQFVEAVRKGAIDNNNKVAHVERTEETLHGKPVIRYFVSYAHDDGDLKEKLLKSLKQLLNNAQDYCFKAWDDGEIQVGERWHEQIQTAIAQCDFGLLLVSPAFLDSSYIKDHELPAFVASNIAVPESRKRSIPVALKRVPFDGSIDTKGLDQLQIFHHGSARKTFQQCRGDSARNAFALELFQQILKNVKH